MEFFIGITMMPKPEQTRWASQEAACKAEINQAKDTFDLVRLANAVARLDALHAEMDAAAKSGSKGCTNQEAF